jgi:hypothetical protein
MSVKGWPLRSRTTMFDAAASERERGFVVARHWLACVASGVHAFTGELKCPGWILI